MSRSELVLRDGRVLPKECFHLSFARSGGPGGQHANKTETKVDLRLDLAAAVAAAVLSEGEVARIRTVLAHRLDADGRLCVTASEHRSQFQNLAAALERMAALLATALARPKRRVATKPTRGSQRRRLEEKRRRGDVKRLRGGGPGGE